VRVLHLIPSLEVGGAEKLLLDLVMTSRACEHLVVAMVAGGALEPHFRDAGIQVENLRMNRARPHPRAVPRLRAIVRRECPEIVQGWMYHANLLAWAATVGMRARPKLVWGLHTADMDVAHMGRITRGTIALGRYLSSAPAAVIANSGVTRDYHASSGYHPREWAIIPNGIDVDRFTPDASAHASVHEELGLPEETKLVGFFARWHPMKRHRLFFRAAEMVAPKNGRVHFVLAGPGVTSKNPELRDVLEGARGLRGRVSLLGLRHDMPRLNAALWAAVVASESESFCLTAAEAMASGAPCVVPDLPVLRDLVGVTGFFFPGGEVGSMADAMSQALDLHESDWRGLGWRARERIVERFSLESMTASYEALYHRLTGEGPPSRQWGSSSGL
jgi:glycosyltransferase involved in cell wall biosynthesis